jgi:hypothetical protein
MYALTRKPCGRRRLSTVDLLLLTSFDQMLFILKILFTYVTKYVALMRRSIVLNLLLQLVFPGFSLKQGTKRDILK